MTLFFLCLCIQCSIFFINNFFSGGVEFFSYLEVSGVVCVMHQVILIGALQLEAVGDPAVGRAVLAVAVEFGQTVTVTKLLEILVGAVHSASTQVLHYA